MRGINFNGTNLEIFRSVSARPAMVRKSREMSWIRRSYVVVFYYHPFLGARSIETCSRVFGIKEATIHGWIFNKALVTKWVDLIEPLTLGHVVDSLEKKIRDLPKFSVMSGDMRAQRFPSNVSLPKPLKTVLFNASGKQTWQFKKATAA